MKASEDFLRDYVGVWDAGAVGDAPFITLGLEAVLSDFYGDLLDAPPPFPVPAGGAVLDLGCGWGRVLKPVLDRGGVGFGLDISARMLERARDHLTANGHAARLLRGDGTRLPFRDESFDCVYSLLVLQHLSKGNGRLVLAEISRVLKKGGSAFIRVPGRFAPENLLFALLQHVSIDLLGARDPIRMRFYRVGEIRDLCAGLFSRVEITAHEFRPPWNVHTPWTWHRILVPRGLHRPLRDLSDRAERAANGPLPFLRHFGVVLMARVIK